MCLDSIDDKCLDSIDVIEEGRNRILLKNRKIRFSVSHEFPFFRSRKPIFFQGGVYPLTHYVRFVIVVL